MNARYVAQSMGLQVYRKHEDVIAVFPLESGNNKLHGLVAQEVWISWQTLCSLN